MYVTQGQTLRQWREAQGWTQEQAAHYLGTTKASVYRWEAARHPIPTCIAILAHLLTSERTKRSVERFLYAARDREPRAAHAGKRQPWSTRNRETS